MLTKALTCAYVLVVAVLACGQPLSPLVASLHLANVGTPQDLQDIAQTISTVSRIRVTGVDNATHDIRVSGSAEQIELAKWLVSELDQSTTAQVQPNSTKHEYLMPGTPAEVIRVFYLSRSETPRDLQELMTLIRAVGNVSYIYPYYSRGALSMRGTADQVGLTGWLLDAMNQPADVQAPAPPISRDYKLPGCELVRVFFLGRTITPQELENITPALRSARIVRSFHNSQRKAQVVRGTPTEVAIAERVIREGR